MERRMQMDPKRFENTYTYHAPKGDQTARYEKLRAKARELAELIEACCPDSREKSLAHNEGGGSDYVGQRRHRKKRVTPCACTRAR